MKHAVGWTQKTADGAARRGTLHTRHGEVATPAFMPVGTRGSVKTLDSRDLTEVGAEMVLANTYHLMERPGEDTVAALGELHGFMAWDGPILTDSGGYQVFSLSPKVTDEGVIFKSSYDGSRVELTPERAVAVQETLGSDVAMILDELVGLPAPRSTVQAAMERTLRWSERAVRSRTRSDVSLFGIIQGGVEPDLRAESASRTAELDVAGFGIGGFSVGEGLPERNLALDATLEELPADRVRYVMGLGDTEGILDAIERGCDLFDCVLPTRLARHGKVLTAEGDFSIKRTEWSRDLRPLDDGCGCLTCERYSRGHLRHLAVTKEPSVQRLLSIHNLTYTLDLMSEVRTAIEEGTFAELRRTRRERRVSRKAQ